jgi:hypothetical protein
MLSSYRTEIEDPHHLRMNRFVGMDPGLLRASLERFTEEQLPQLSRLGGFRTLFFGVNYDLGRAVGTTFWESAGDLRASEPAEAAARTLALARAGGSLSRGLVDHYEIIFEQHAISAEPAAAARLARWEGVAPSRISDAIARFEDEQLPVLQRSHGYCGMFVAVNALLGNTLSVSLWSSRDALQSSLEWEREARSAMESEAGLVPRSVLADTYDVALAPDLRQLAPWPAWAPHRAESLDSVRSGSAAG